MVPYLKHTVYWILLRLILWRSIILQWSTRWCRCVWSKCVIMTLTCNLYKLAACGNCSFISMIKISFFNFSSNNIFSGHRTCSSKILWQWQKGTLTSKSSSLRSGLAVMTTPLLNSSNGRWRSAVHRLLVNLTKVPQRSWNARTSPHSALDAEIPTLSADAKGLLQVAAMEKEKQELAWNHK